VYDSVLYFPQVQVPQGDWLARVLLYWDQVGTIAPRYLGQRFPSYMTNLRAAEQLEVVHPEEHLDRADIRSFDETFTTAVTQELRRDPELCASFEAGRTYDLYIEKISDDLAMELHFLGVAGNRRGFFVEVEENVALCYMAHLARFLGERVAMQPITDHLDRLSALEFGRTREVLARRSELRFEILSEILPSPSSPPPPRELARFKGKHGELLRRFRRRVETELTNLAVIEDREMQDDQKSMTIADMKDEIEEISRRLEEQVWGQIELADLSTLAAVSIGGVAAAFGHQYVGEASALFGLLSLGASTSGRHRQRAGSVAGMPLAYAAFARRKFIAR
jgi:hypothetical protein